MTVLYDDKLCGVRKMGLHFETWQAAQERGAAILTQYPPSSFGTLCRFKRVSDGIEMHMQRLA